MDDPRITAFDPAAPDDERNDALAQMQQVHMPTRSDLLPLAQVIDFAEKVRLNNPDPMLVKSAKVLDQRSVEQRGQQSVIVDPWSSGRGGQYYEPQNVLSYGMMRAMVQRTPVLAAAIGTRLRQVRRFCSVSPENAEPGYWIRHKEKGHKPDATEKTSIDLLQKFFRHCGWESTARKRDMLGRTSFGDFVATLVDDSLTMDSCAIEVEHRKDKRGIDGLYVVDGGSIRLCSEDGYDGDDQLFAVQVINGAVTTGFTREDLIFRPRNPCSSVFHGGYGRSEVEQMVQVITGFLNAMQANISGFNENEIPPGILLLSGNFGVKDLDAFRRYMKAMTEGPGGRWKLPFLSSEDQTAAASFVRLTDPANEMLFSKWMTFLVSIICALFGMSPDEINFESFSAGHSSLSGSDTAEKLASSKDKGLRPLLSYFEQLFTSYVVEDFSDKYVFEWTGLEERDPEKQHELNKLAWTFNELRAEQGLKSDTSGLGDCPVNPSLIGPWMQMQQQPEPGDFGQPGGGAVPPQGGPGEEGPGGPQGGPPQAGGQPPPMPQDEAPPGQDFGGGKQLDFGKSLAPIWAIGR